MDPYLKAVGDLVVLGGGSLVADYLLPRLAGRFARIDVVSRQPRQMPPGVTAVAFETLQAGTWTCPPQATVICLQPLPTLIPLLPRLAAATTVVALGSTRCFGNAASPDPQERAGARDLVLAEAELARWCGAQGVGFTLLRPTLIYDMRRDQNIARMAGFIRRYGVLPLAWPARGLRQPIHADDVAKAILGALRNPAAANRAFNIAGAERLTYRAMAVRVFASLGRRPRLVMLPLGLITMGFRLAGRFGLIGNAAIGSSVFQRMNEDLVFDGEDGLRVLRYDPRPFEPDKLNG